MLFKGFSASETNSFEFDVNEKRRLVRGGISAMNWLVIPVMGTLKKLCFFSRFLGLFDDKQVS